MTKDQLHELFEYKDGNLYWKIVKTNSINIGQIAGTNHCEGYRQIKINGKIYKEHRLIWLYETGVMPKKYIDHKNRVRSDNRLCNLREANFSDNCQNISLPKHNTSGHMGISWYARDNKWNVYIKINGKNKWLGRYSLLDEAIKTRKLGEDKYYNLPKQETASC